jgi:phytoene dehydrogenase-like protein
MGDDARHTFLAAYERRMLTLTTHRESGQRVSYHVAVALQAKRSPRRYSTQTDPYTFLRPVPRWDPYRTPLRGVYPCSASTPPGPGCPRHVGYLAALSTLRREFGVRVAPSLSPSVLSDTRTCLCSYTAAR